MIAEKDRRKQDVAAAMSPTSDPAYQPPRVVKTSRLAEVTGQGAVVPSGAPAPPPG